MLPGTGKFTKTGIGIDPNAKSSADAAFVFLKANGNRISGNISTTMKDYIINYQDLQGVGMTPKLAMPSSPFFISRSLNRASNLEREKEEERKILVQV